MNVKKILLAYSGGLDTSCILTWLKETYKVPIVAYCANIGQQEDFEAIHKKALSTGAEKCIVQDLRKEFANNYIIPSVQANAVYESVYLMGTSLARPCIAQGMIDTALKEGCDAIAHGCTGKGNDQVRFELTVKALSPHLQVIAPWRQWEFTSRNDLFDYAEQHNIPLPATREKPYSIDANLMHISYEGGILEDPWLEPPDNMFTWTSSPEAAPDQPENITIEFNAGIPVGVNGKKLDPLELIEYCNKVGANHGIGRVDCVENRYIGIKSRGVYETPGVSIIMKAHQAVETLTMDKEVTHLKEYLTLKFAELVYNGYWFAPEMKVLRKALDETQSHVTGVARLKLYKGNAQVTGRKAKSCLYSNHIASFENMSAFSPADSGGFININGLRLSNWSKTYESIEKGVPQTT